MNYIKYYDTHESKWKWQIAFGDDEITTIINRLAQYQDRYTQIEIS